MVYKCNLNSFLRNFSSKVLSCEPATAEKNVRGYNVEFEDTILFPEGGGQPCDYGIVNGIPVKCISRVGERAINFFEGDVCPFKVGDDVEMEIDWDRRLDHMQHHSGQHLITALFDNRYGFYTKSWYLGADYAFLELGGTDSVTQEQLDEIEKEANRIVVEALPVTMKIYQTDDPEWKQYIKECKEPPPEGATEIKVISIGGLDNNMCCGTHVQNTGQLQAVALLNAEKKKGKLLVNFIIGNRVLKSMKDSYKRELTLNNLLNNGPPMHIELVKKLQTSLKVKNKSLETSIKLLASHEADKLKKIDPKPKYYCIHYSGIDFLTDFNREYKTDGIFLFITFIDETNTGKLYLRGTEDEINTIGGDISALLDGKVQKKGKFIQGRFDNIKKIPECDKMLAKYFEQK